MRLKGKKGWSIVNLLRQQQKLEFQVCSGELIDLVDGCLPVWEDLVCAHCTSVVGVPTAVFLQEESVQVSPCTVFVPFFLNFFFFFFALSALVCLLHLLDQVVSTLHTLNCL